jgi:hypothetical protein
MNRRACLFLLAAAGFGQVQRPQIGYIVDRSGFLRPVEGVAGAFILGPPIESDVVCASFSGRVLIVKKALELIVDRKSFAAPSGPAHVSFTPNGQLKHVFFADADRVWAWNGSGFDEKYAIADPETANQLRDASERLNRPVRQLSQLGEDWHVAYTDERIFAIGPRQIFELPEAD